MKSHTASHARAFVVSCGLVAVPMPPSGSRGEQDRLERYQALEAASGVQDLRAYVFEWKVSRAIRWLRRRLPQAVTYACSLPTTIRRWQPSSDHSTEPSNATQETGT